MRAPVAAESADSLLNIPAARVKQIERIVAAARGRVEGTSLQLRRRFLRAYFRGVGEEDLAQREPASFAAVALRHLTEGRVRQPRHAHIEVFNPDEKRDGFTSPHTVVLIVTDDMPFLVDSVGVVFSQAEVAMHTIIHPVLSVWRDGRGRLQDVGSASDSYTESWQFYEIDRQTDPARLEAIKQKLEATLADVRVAVEDWMPIRERVRALSADLKNSPPSSLDTEEVREARELLDWMESRHFVFLGYRYYKLQRGSSQDKLVPDSRSGLGILRASRHLSHGIVRTSPTDGQPGHRNG